MRSGSSLWLFSTLLYMRIVHGKNNYILLSERQNLARGLALTRMFTAVLPISLLSFYALSISSEDICRATFVPITLISRMKKTKLKDQYLIRWSFGPYSGTVGLQDNMPRVCGQRVPLVSRCLGRGTPDFLPLSSTS